MSDAPEGSAAPPGALVPLRLVAAPLLLGFLAEAPGWLLVAAAWPTHGAWYGSPGLRAGLHLVTFGALVLPIVGAGWQLVPVVTARPLGATAHRAAAWANGFVVAGAVLLWTGLALGWPLAAAGSAAVATGLLLRAAVLVPALIRARERVGMRAWLVSAELALLAGLGVAVHLLGVHLGAWPPGDTITEVYAHARALGAGWAGGYVVGLGALLLPMFALGREPGQGILGALALAWYAGLFVGSAAGWGVTAVAVALLLVRALGGPRAALSGAARGGGPGLVQARLALVGLATAGLGAVGGVDPPLVGALALAGWLVPAQHGLATRVVPFLLWAHVLADVPTGRRPAPATLVSTRLAWLQVGATAGGAVLLAVGLGSGTPVSGRVGALALGLAALLHLATALGVALRTYTHWRRAQALPGTEAP